MATLHVRSVPDDLYQQLWSMAQTTQRSLSAQVVTMLQRAIEEEQRRQQQAQVLEAIRRRRFTPPVGAPTAVELLGEDRAR